MGLKIIPDIERDDRPKLLVCTDCVEVGEIPSSFEIFKDDEGKMKIQCSTCGEEWEFDYVEDLYEMEKK